MRLEKALLAAGVAVPILYYGNLVLSSLFYPGYSHVRQYASELGGPDAPHPAIFNTLTMILGVCGVAAGVGLYLAVRRLTGRTVLAALAGLLAVLFGVAMIFGGAFPMPDERHGGYGLGMAVHLAPLALAAALWKRADLRAFNLFLLGIWVAGLVFFAIMMGVGQMVTRANVGLFQRAYSLTSFPWLGIACYALGRALHRHPPASTRAERRAVS